MCPLHLTSCISVFLRVEQDRECNMDCAAAPRKPLCASDGRTFSSRCEFLRAKCRDPQLEVIRGPCKGQVTSHTLEQQAKKRAPEVFVPVCNPDGTYSEVQCHSYTGYCWCVTPNGRPISGSAVANKKPRCQGMNTGGDFLTNSYGAAVSRSLSSLNPPTHTHTLLMGHFVLKSHQKSKTLHDISSSCNQEQQSAQEEARQHKNEAVFVPDCAHGGLFKSVQCHPSTGYCWCVLVDTGRPIPGTATRYEQPKCDGNARANPNPKPKDHYKSRHLQGCPGAKKAEFLTSVLDALSTDMVQAVTDPASASRMLEPDPSHTLEERVVHWYFSQLDKNSSGDIGKKEIKPFKRLLRKKSKPKKCVKKFVEYCDISNDKALSLQELMGCLGVTKEDVIWFISDIQGNPFTSSFFS
uniref:SPARC related modular calcium binding 2 n=1 Tax=Denticeps clupeoides TaxID=299321 RepID=A0AAY4BJG1_9TELE